jgi:hypothetical protein
MVLLLVGFLAENVISAVIYVDTEAIGENDGTSWSNAYTELQSALSDAQTGDEIWVAEGTYKPDQYATNPGGTGNRYEAFQLKNGVAIYGGFDPTDGDVLLSDRNWKKNPNILSGDIGVPNNSSDNSYHVFYHPSGTNLKSSALLDGFIITKGNANGSVYPHQDGGGVFNRESSPTFQNCSFIGNSAEYGGGMYNQLSSPELNNCKFYNNSSDSGGGGMYNYDASPALTDCTFSNNSSINGAGMYNYSLSTSTPVLIGCSFVGNEGNGIFNAQSSPSLINCIFYANNGRGMHNINSSPILINCTFSANLGLTAGGIFNQNSSPQLKNCILWRDLPIEILNVGSSIPDITYSNIDGGYEGEGNINADPEFGKLGLYLTALSPCVDGGTSEGAPSTDIEGELRPFGNGVDMGADEHYGDCAIGDLDCDGDVDGADLADFADVYGY